MFRYLCHLWQGGWVGEKTRMKWCCVCVLWKKRNWQQNCSTEAWIQGVNKTQPKKIPVKSSLYRPFLSVLNQYQHVLRRKFERMKTTVIIVSIDDAGAGAGGGGLRYRNLPASLDGDQGDQGLFFKKLEEEKLQTRDLNYLFSLGWIENLYPFDL